MISRLWGVAGLLSGAVAGLALIAAVVLAPDPRLAPDGRTPSSAPSPVSSGPASAPAPSRTGGPGGSASLNRSGPPSGSVGPASSTGTSAATLLHVRTSATFPFALDFDGSANRDWAVVGIPTHFWIDASGIIRDAAEGASGVTVTP